MEIITELKKCSKHTISWPLQNFLAFTKISRSAAMLIEIHCGVTIAKTMLEVQNILVMKVRHVRLVDFS